MPNQRTSGTLTFVDAALTPDTGARRGMNLALATWVSAINFWAWNMIGPLSTTYAGDMTLSSTEASMLVATPILVGALGRIVIGALTDRFGGRTMFIAVSWRRSCRCWPSGRPERRAPTRCCWCSASSWASRERSSPSASRSRTTGTKPARRGFATGVFGMGMVGTALSAFFTPRFVRWFGLFTTHVIVAVALAVTAVVCIFVMRNAPSFTPNTGPVLPKLKAAAKLRSPGRCRSCTRWCSAGSWRSPTICPPTSRRSTGSRRSTPAPAPPAFALAAVLARPVGGALSDRIAPKYVVLASFAGTAVMAFIAVFQPPPDVWSARDVHHAGALPRHRHRRRVRVGGPPRPAKSVGSVTGIVAAAGGLGGYFPPLVMGATYDQVDNNYTIGLLLLVATALVAFGVHGAAPARARTVHRRQGGRHRDHHAALGGRIEELLERSGRFFTPGEFSDDLRTVTRRGGREGDVFYRDRWSHDKVVRSTHGVNCTGSCSWKIYVKDGIITWETQETDYPSVGPDRPEYEPAAARAARRSPGTPTRRPGCGTRTPAACWSRCTGRPRPGSATRCWRGPTSRPIPSAAAATSRPAARAAWCG